jgi:ligand-binding sensor domain-containing protein
MKKVVLLSLLIASQLFSLNLYSQELTWKQYTVNDGLVQSQINKIFQDNKGYLWISTRFGVSRFDGIHFENFTEKDGLLSNWAGQIEQDAKGNIWILFSNGLTRYDGLSFKNFIFPAHLKDKISITYYPVSADSVVIYQLSKNNVLKEFFLINDNFSSGKQIQFLATLAERPNMPVIKYDKVSKTLWIVDKAGLLYSYKKGTLKKHDLKYLQGLQPGPDGKFYYIDDGSLYCLQNDQTKLLLRDTFKHDDINNRFDLAIDKTGNIVVSYLNANRAKIFSAINSSITDIHFPISIDFVFDKEQNLWAGTENGLYRANSLSIINFLPEKGGLNTNVWSITEGKTGEIYFSSYYDGLQQYKNGKFTLEKTLPTLPNGSKTYLAMGSMVDADHNIYLTTQYYPMIKFDGQTFTILPKLKKPIPSFIIRQNRNDGSLMIGGISYYVKVNKDMTFDSLKVLPGNGKSTVVTGIEADKYNRIWLGGFNGMSMLLGDSLIHLPTAEFPFENGGNTLLRDHRDNMWIGNKNGLYFYNYNNFEKIGHPLLNDLVVSLITVGDTMLFIGSINKIYKLNLKNFYAHKPVELISVGEDKGFVGIEPGQNGFFKDSKGYLWLPCNDRCVRLDPQMLHTNAEPPRVYITNLQVLDEKMAWKKVASNEDETVRFSLQHDEKNLKFDFIGISLRHPQGVMYSFMLEGYDENWSEPAPAQSAVYTNLPPGNYRFKVKAANTDGITAIKQAIVNFTIVPALYQKRWFQLLIILIAATLLFTTGAYVMHLRRKKQRQELENDYNMSELRLLAIQNQIEPHFTYNALNTIAAAVLKEEKTVAYSYFVKLSQLMRTVLQTNSQLITTLEDEIIFVTNYLQIQQLRFTNKFDFIIEVADDVEQHTIIPKMCIQTFSENAIKHGLLPKPDKGRLSISIFNEGDFLCIHLEDNGIGQDKARLLQTNGSSNGLKIMKGYFEHFNLLNDKKLDWQIVDLYTFDKESRGTGVYVRIPRGFVYSKR